MFKKKWLVMVWLLVMMSFLPALSQEAERIVVTALNVETVNEKELLEITLNDRIQIREIETKEFAGRTIIEFPAFISRRGTVFPRLEVLKEELHQEIIRAVESGRPSVRRPGKLRWEITNLREFRGRRAGAHFSLTFNQALRINGRVMERDDGTAWIAWPARPPREGESGWQRQVRILDRELRQEIEKALIEGYKKLVN